MNPIKSTAALVGCLFATLLLNVPLRAAAQTIALIPDNVIIVYCPDTFIGCGNGINYGFNNGQSYTISGGATTYAAAVAAAQSAQQRNVELIIATTLNGQGYGRVWTEESGEQFNCGPGRAPCAQVRAEIYYSDYADNKNIPDGENACDKTQPPTVGNPISLGGGQKLQTEAILAELSDSMGQLRLFYGSQIPGGRMFGLGWGSDYSAYLNGSFLLSASKIENGYISSLISIRDNGSGTLFSKTADGTWSSVGTDRRFALAYSSGQFRLWDKVGNLIDTFNGSGELISRQLASGPSLTIQRNVSASPYPWPPVIDATFITGFGRSTNFIFGSNGLASSLVDVMGNTTQFSYQIDGSKMLSSVAFPDGSSRQYFYLPTVGLQNKLTGIQDENQSLFASWTYDTSGRAVTSEHAGSVEKYTIDYISASASSITDPNGNTLGYQLANLGGKPQLTSRTQPAGNGCAASSKALSYDSNGNLASLDDFNGNRACFVSELTRNLETVRVEGLATTLACSAVTGAGSSLPANSRKINTTWHPDWRLVVRRAEPGRLTTKVYNGQPDPLNGGAVASCAPITALLPDGKPIAVLCKQVEQATTDTDGHLGFDAALQPGVPNRIQTWTYNSYGQVLTAKGPRTDVNDTTTYAYYLDTLFTGADPGAVGHTIGDLQALTNAAGKVTTFTKYNKAGQVLEMSDANGVLTTNIYDSRQRLLSSTSAGETTSYTYDAVGQLKTTTLPNGAVITNTYDGAHRLTQVQDAAGNTIVYTLDNLGNRIGEQVKDPGGNVIRSITRSYDALNRLQRVTGAAR